MAQTDITLRAGEASPTDVRLYATGTAAEAAPILVYLCQTATQPSASEISLTLRAGEASSTDIRLYSSSYTAASQDTDVILRPVGLPCGTVTSSAALTAVESADAFAGTVEVITVAASDLAIAALESPDAAAFSVDAVHAVAFTVVESADAFSGALTAEAAGGAVYTGGWEEWLLRREASEAREVASRVAEPVERAVRRAAERSQREELSAKRAAAVLRDELAALREAQERARVEVLAGLERAAAERAAAEEYRRAQALLIMYRRLLAQVEDERAELDAMQAARARRNRIAAAFLMAAATLH